VDEREPRAVTFAIERAMGDETRSWVVDSVTEGIAAVEEDGARMLAVPAWLLPAGAREGAVLRVSRRDEGAGVSLRIEVDHAATAAAAARARARLDRLAGSDPGGDLEL
jgi:hypothetical protein